MSCNEIIDELELLKKNLVFSLTKYSLTGEDDYNNEIVLNSILFSWLESLSSLDDFNKKYFNFKKLKEYIYDTGLFYLVESISSNDNEKIKRAKEIYNGIINDNNYIKLTSNSGYKLPSEFEIDSCYENGFLKKNIQLFKEFASCLSDINKKINKKGVYIK